MIIARLHMVKDVMNAESRKGKLLGAGMGTLIRACVCGLSVRSLMCFLVESLTAFESN